MADLLREKMEQIRKQGYRPVVVACFINRQKVLMFYKLKHKLWQLPQGGIEAGETASQALRREMKEELGRDLIKKNDKMIYLGADMVGFPSQTQARRELKTETGGNIRMRGKKYFFVAIQDKLANLDITKTEFDQYRWVDFEAAIKLADKIYQYGKKRITVNALQLLKQKNLIN